MRIACAALALLAIVAHAAAAPTYPAPGGILKSAVQFRLEATRHDTAVKGLEALATARILTAADLKAASARLDALLPDLRFAGSRLVALGYDDRRFTTAIASNFANPSMAQDFARRLAADHTIAARLDGATELKARMATHLTAVASTLQRAINNLHAARQRLAGGALPVQPKYFAPPTPDVWNPVANAVIASIVFSYPSLTSSQATDTGAFRFPYSTVSAFADVAGSITFDNDLRRWLEAVKMTQSALEAIGDRHPSPDMCDLNANADYRRCLADVANKPDAERERAKLLCDQQYESAKSFCVFIDNVGTGYGSLISRVTN